MIQEKVLFLLKVTKVLYVTRGGILDLELCGLLTWLVRKSDLSKKKKNTLVRTPEMWNKRTSLLEPLRCETKASVFRKPSHLRERNQIIELKSELSS